MSRDPFATMLAMQKQAVTLVRSHQRAVDAMLVAGQDAAVFGRTMTAATQTGIRAWQDWLSMWMPPR